MLGMFGTKIMSENQLLNGYANGITPNGTCVYAVQVQRLINGYKFQSMAYTQCYAAKRTVKNYESNEFTSN